MIRKAKALLASIFALALVAGPLSVQVAEAAPLPPSVTLDIFTFNDFHGRIDNGITVPFFATLEKAAAEATTAGHEVATVSAGDNIGASLFASFVQDDEPTLDVLNLLADPASGANFGASAVGNHEFDRGFADLTGRVEPYAGFRYLGANVVTKGTTTPALTPYFISTTANGLRVAFIGAVTIETTSLVSPGGIANVDFTDPVAAVNKYAAEIKAAGTADVIIAVYHEGAATAASLADAVAATEIFKRIVNETSSDVAAIVTGHTHLKYAWQQGDRPIVQTGSYGDNVGHIELTLDTTGTGLYPVTAANVENIARDTTMTEAQQDAIGNIPAIRAVVDAAIATGVTLGDRVVAKVDSPITTAFAGGEWKDGVYTGGTRDDRANESALGRLVADAYLWTANDSDVIGGADIGIINAGGGLRAELLCDAAKDGVITYAEANAIQPFVNNLWTIELTGEQFKMFLEEQWSYNVNTGARNSRPFLNTGVSSNVTYTVTTDQPLPELLPPELCTLDDGCSFSDARSHITSVFIDGKPLDPAATYKIITVSFLTTGGDNYWVMNDGANRKDTGLVDRDAWIGYLLQASGIKTPGETPTKAITAAFSRMSVVVTNLSPATEPMKAIEVTAGETVSFTLSRLNLTSQGSKANTGVTTTLVPAAGGAEVTLGTFSVAAPSDAAACTAAGVSATLNPLSTGCVAVEVVVPTETPAGTYYLKTVAAPTNTTIWLEVKVAAAPPVVLPVVTGPTVETGGSVDGGLGLGSVALLLLVAGGALLGVRRRLS